MPKGINHWTYCALCLCGCLESKVLRKWFLRTVWLVLPLAFNIKHKVVSTFQKKTFQKETYQSLFHSHGVATQCFKLPNQRKNLHVHHTNSTTTLHRPAPPKAHQLVYSPGSDRWTRHHRNPKPRKSPQNSARTWRSSCNCNFIHAKRGWTFCASQLISTDCSHSRFHQYLCICKVTKPQLGFSENWGTKNWSPIV